MSSASCRCLRRGQLALAVLARPGARDRPVVLRAEGAAQLALPLAAPADEREQRHHHRDHDEGEEDGGGQRGGRHGGSCSRRTV
jgi:hypothetical protein